MPEPVAPKPCHPDSFPGETAVPIHRCQTATSTNDLARDWIQHSPESPVAVWIAEEQTGGRATRGRSWASPPGGLWMTMAARLQDSHPLPGLSLRVGLAMIRSARSVLDPDAPARLRLRWPNDLIALQPGSDSIVKLGGCLIEHLSPWVIIGLGINANNPPPSLDPDGKPLRTPAASLSEIGKQPINLEALATDLTGQLRRLVPLAGLPATTHSEIESLLYRPSGPISIEQRDGTLLRGQIRGIAHEPPHTGSLILRTDEGEILVSGGEFR